MVLEFETESEQSQHVYIEHTKEGKEVRLNTAKVLKESADFYATHSLNDFLKELPKEVKLSPQSEARLREALRERFDKAILLPSAEVQAANFEKLIEETATKEIPGFPESEQYTNPYIESDVKDLRQSVNRPKQKAYLLLYQSGPLPDETKGKTLNNLDQLFAKNKWNGFALEEYLLSQRKEAETRKDHFFDTYSEDEKNPNGQWLLDSRMPEDGATIGSWSPKGNPDVEEQKIYVD